jgi:hypothetical protein
MIVQNTEVFWIAPDGRELQTLSEIYGAYYGDPNPWVKKMVITPDVESHLIYKGYRKEIIQRVHYEEIIGSDAARIACQKSKYGRRVWVVWQDKQNRLHGAPSTAATVKAAMLATGTQRGFTSYYSGVSHLTDWWTANNMRRQLLRQDY